MENADGRCVYEFGDFRVDAVQRLLSLKATGARYRWSRGRSKRSCTSCSITVSWLDKEP